MGNIKNKISLTIILPDCDGGVASFVENLLYYTDRDRFNIQVILLEKKNSTTCLVNFSCDTLVRIHFKQGETLFSKCSKVIPYLRENSILISNDGGLELDTYDLYKLCNPLIYIIHGDNDYYYNIIRNKGYLMDKVIAVSQHIGGKSINLIDRHFYKASVDIIHFPVRDIYIDKICSSNINIHIIFVGALTVGKGVQYFEPLIKTLKERSIEFSFFIIGSGPLKSHIDYLSEEYTEVNYLGRLSNDDVICHLKGKDVFFLPTHSEGLPISIVEAMKSGLAIISSEIESGIPEIVLNGITGYRVEPGNINDYAEKIEILVKNPQLLHKLKDNACTHANTYFSPYNQTEKYLEAFLSTNCNSEKPYRSSLFKKIIYQLPDSFRLFLKHKLVPFIKIKC